MWVGLRTLFFATLLVVGPVFGQEERYLNGHETADQIKQLTTEVERLYGLGEFAQALVVALRAADAALRTRGATDAMFADALVNVALMHKVQGRYSEAEEVYNQALSIYKLALGDEHADVATALNNLANLYLAKGGFVAAETTYKRSLRMRERVLGANHLEVATSLNNLAELYRAIGRGADAENFLKRALTIRESALPANALLIADTVNNLAALYYSMGRYEDALQFSMRDLALSEAALRPDHPSVAVSLNNLGEIYNALGRYSEAEALLLRSVAIHEKELGPDHPDVGATLNNLGRAYEAQGHYSKAQAAFERDLEISRKVHGPDHPDIAQSLRNLGYLAMRQQNWSRAYTNFRQSTDILSRRSELWGVSAKSLVGKTQKESVRSASSYSGLVMAAYRLAKLRRFGSLGTKPLTDTTFIAVQWAQASEAAEALSQMAGRNPSGDSRLSKAIRARQDLINEWQARDEQQSYLLSLNAGHQGSYEANISRMMDIEAKLHDIDQNLLNDFPTYKGFVEAKPPAVAEVQSLLDGGEALVLVHDTAVTTTASKEIFVWVITRKDSRWVGSEIGTSTLSEKVQALRCGLDSDEWAGIGRAARCAKILGIDAIPEDGEPLPFRLDIAYSLYQTLFAQIEDLIKGKQLLIVPSGPLTSLPFQVLVTEKPGINLPDTYEAYKGVAWFGARQPITVLPSVASLQALRQRTGSSAAPRAYLGYGNPVLRGSSGCAQFGALPDCKEMTLSKQATRGTRAVGAANLDDVFRRGAAQEAVLSAVSRLCPLPDTAVELRCVAESLGAAADELRIGLAATEADIKSRKDLDQYRIIHFATHGLLAGDTEMLARRQGEPALVLTPPQASEREDDNGLLTASEITELKLDADWVILSACNTAAGEKLGAQALSGLARAFFYAGARAILVSHWPVYSNAAVAITTSAFQETRQHPGIGRAEAMRRAMVALMTSSSHVDNPHPAVWAPFTLVGEGGGSALKLDNVRSVR